MSKNSSSSDDNDDNEKTSQNSQPTNLIDLISWNSLERKLSQLRDTFHQYSTANRLFIVKSRCLAVNCNCNFRNYDSFLAKSFIDCKLLIGKWCKLKFSKSNSALPDIDKLGTFIFFKSFPGWWEVMNENLEVIPYWNKAQQIVQNSPRAFLIRNSVKGLVIRPTAATEDANSPLQFDSVVVASGTILAYCSCKKYPMKKGRKIKDQQLVKCRDNRGNCFYFPPDEPIFASPIAGLDNISGVHSIESIIEKFRFPLNLKPLFNVPPVPSLSCTDRNFLLLSDRLQLDLIFLTPINEPKRLFIITPAMFDDHVFTIGDIVSATVTRAPIPAHITAQIDSHQSKINDFLAKCHQYDSLSYLVKYSENVSKVCPKFETTNPEFDDTYLEVEDIYFYIRNGFYPRNSIRFGKQKKPEIEKKPNEKASGGERKPVVSNSSSSSTESDENDNDNDDESSSSTDNNDNDNNINNNNSNDKGHDSSSSSSSTSITTESDFTSSTALELSKRQHKSQAKSMPLSNNNAARKTCKLINSRSNKSPRGFQGARCRIDLSTDDMLNFSTSSPPSSLATPAVMLSNSVATQTTPPVPIAPTPSAPNDSTDEERDGRENVKRSIEIPEFYQQRLLESQKFKISEVDNFSLKNTAV